MNKLETDFLQSAEDGNFRKFNKCLKEGVSLYCVDDKGNNAFLKAAKKKKLKMIEHLLALNFNIDYQNNNNICALSYAIQNNDELMVKFLLNMGANPNIVNNDRTHLASLLNEAMYENNKVILELFLTHPQINVNINMNHNTPLEQAAIYYNYSLCKRLINLGANVNVIYDEKTSELLINACVKRGAHDIALLLLEQKNVLIDDSLFLLCVKHSSKKMIKKLIDLNHYPLMLNESEIKDKKFLKEVQQMIENQQLKEKLEKSLIVKKIGKIKKI
jgi:ankyrin repeat protein